MRRGGDRRGSAKSRRARKVWMLATFDPDLGPDQARCRLVLSDRCLGILDHSTITPDRLVLGSGYDRAGIQPACRNCQNVQGALVTNGRWPLGVAS